MKGSNMNRHVICGKEGQPAKRLSGQNCNRFQWVVPLLIVIALYAVCAGFGFMRYHTNDDASIQDYLSGQYTGTPLSGHQFIHVFLSWFISRLYILFPGVEWWFTGSQIMMACGMLLINYTLLVWIKQNELSFGSGVFLMILADCCLLCFPLCRLSYTTVSGVVGTGGLCVLLIFCGKPKRVPACAISYVMFVTAFCLRNSVGYILICFYLLGVLILCLKDRGSRLRKAGAFAAAVFVLVGTAMGLNAVNSDYQNRVNGPEFRSFNIARTAYMDYPHDSYEQNPELYASVGWSQETAWLVSKWCFMDERVTAENLNYLVQHSTSERNTIRPGTIKQRFLEFQQIEMVQPTEWFWFITGLFSLITVVMCRKGKLVLLCLVNLTGTAVLVFWQLYSGRILYRTLMVCLLPSAVISLGLGICGLKDLRRGRIGRALIWVLLLCILPVAVSSMRTTFDPGTISKAVVRKQRADALGEYALEHPENIYIQDTRTVDDLFPLSPRPVNLIVWGKPDFNSAAQKMRLKVNGIERLTGAVLKNQNVYFISDISLSDRAGNGKRVPDSSKLLHFYRWLQQEYGATGIRQEDRIRQDLFVYRFMFEQDGPEGEFYDIQSDRHVISGGA